ncbi:MAG TPA: MFS transporter [Thermoanaerobaculia bacterium]|jgi:MFS family permease|nr:MFS transporter [Thermoanaerobaculia bacterium]
MFLDLGPLRRHRDFRALYFGQFVSFVGSMITYVAIPYQVYQLTRSSFAVGMLSTVSLVPLLIAGLFGGATADAMDRRKLLIGSELLLMVCSIGLALNAALPHPSVAVPFVVAGLMSALNGFHRPALEAMTPRLVDRDEIPAAATLSSVRGNIGMIAGPALGGACIATLGMPAAYAIDAVTFALCAAAVASMKAMPAAEGAPVPGLAAVAEGLRYAWSRVELVGTYVVDIVAMTFAMPMALFPAMATAWGGAAAAGWLYSAMPIGALMVSLVSGRAGRVRRHGAAVVVAAALWGVAVVALGYSRGLLAAVVLLALAGAADMVSGVYRKTIWDQTIPVHLRGRLAGVEMISYMTGPLLGNARAGWVAGLVSPRFSIVSGGWMCVAGVLLCVPLLPGFWRYRADSGAPTAVESP